MYVKRCNPLFAEWSGGGIYLISPADARTRLKVGPGVVSLLNDLTGWTTRERILARTSDDQLDHATAAAMLELLVRHGIVVTKESDPAEAVPQPWGRWGTIAMLYHRHARDATYITDPERRRSYIGQVAEEPPPPMGKTYPGHRRIHLPRRHRSLHADFEEVLLRRRTHREFTAIPVAVEDLATLLQVTFGPQQFVDGGPFGTVQLRASPNAGARHEIECYAVALNVATVPAGLYHYDALDHSLELLSTSVTRSELGDLLYGQPMAKTTPVICFTTVVTERISYKYRDGRAYRLWLYDVGHAGQTFVLTATALGLGAFQTAAFRDSATDAILGVDGNREFTSYVLGCGHVADLAAPADLLPSAPGVGRISCQSTLRNA